MTRGTWVPQSDEPDALDPAPEGAASEVESLRRENARLNFGSEMLRSDLDESHEQAVHWMKEVESLLGQVAALWEQLRLEHRARYPHPVDDDVDCSPCALLGETSDAASEYIAGERARAVADWLADPATVRRVFGVTGDPEATSAVLEALAAPPTAAPEAER